MQVTNEDEGSVFSRRTTAKRSNPTLPWSNTSISAGQHTTTDTICPKHGPDFQRNNRKRRSQTGTKKRPDCKKLAEKVGSSMFRPKTQTTSRRSPMLEKNMKNTRLLQSGAFRRRSARENLQLCRSSDAQDTLIRRERETVRN